MKTENTNNNTAATIVWNNSALNGLLKGLDLCAKCYRPFHSMKARLSTPIMKAEAESGNVYYIRLFKSYETPTAIVATNAHTGAAFIFAPDAYIKAARNAGSNGTTSGTHISRLARDSELGLLIRTGYKPGITRIGDFRGAEYKSHVSEIYVNPRKAARMLLEAGEGADMLAAFADILNAIWKSLPEAIPGGDPELTGWARGLVTTANTANG